MAHHRLTGGPLLDCPQIAGQGARKRSAATAYFLKQTTTTTTTTTKRANSTFSSKRKRDAPPPKKRPLPPSRVHLTQHKEWGMRLIHAAPHLTLGEGEAFIPPPPRGTPCCCSREEVDVNSAPSEIENLTKSSPFFPASHRLQFQTPSHNP